MCPSPKPERPVVLQVCEENVWEEYWAGEDKEVYSLWNNQESFFKMHISVAYRKWTWGFQGHL